jgi:hypothetical protein
MTEARATAVQRGENVQKSQQNMMRNGMMMEFA